MPSGVPDSWGSGVSTPSLDLRGYSPSRIVPTYVLFLIASGILTILLICILYIYHRRMVRQSLGDLERVFVAERPRGAERTAQENAARPDATVPAVNPNVKCCDKDVELTFVVMAGEDQPTFLARPLNTSQELASSSRTATCSNLPL